MWSRITQHPYLAVFLFALISHAAISIALIPTGFHHTAMTDGTQYMTLADNVLAGRGFSEHTEAPYVPDTIRTPLYPYYLVASKWLTGSFDPSLALSVLLGATIPLAGMLLLKLLGRTRVSELLGVGLFLAVDPHMWFYSLIYGSEAVFLPLVAWTIVGSAFVLTRPNVKVGIATGILFGLSVLARPIVELFPCIVALFLIVRWWKDAEVRRTAWKTAAALVLSFAVVVAPWIYRNVKLFGAFDFTNIGWFNMYTRVAATTYAIHTHQDYPSVRVQFLQRLHDKGYIAKSPVEEQDVHGFEWKPIFKKETWEIIKMYPREFIVSQISAFFTVISQDITAVYAVKMGLVRFTYPSFAPFYLLSQEGLVATVKAIWRILSWPLASMMLGRVLWLVVFALSLWSLVVAWKRQRGAFPLALLLVIYQLYITALSLNAAAQADARYRSQFLFSEVPLAAFALAGIVAARRERVARRLQSAVTCPACGSASEVRSWGKTRGYPIYRCRLCTTRFVWPRPSDADLAAFYSEGYFFGGEHGGYVNYDADKLAAVESLDAFITHIERHVPSRGKLLDLGAATGVFLDLAKQRGWDVHGHEVSEAAAERARGRGIPMTVGLLSNAGYTSGMFDAISLLDVIEHVPDPAQTMREVASLVAPGGVVLLNTPDAGSVFARLMGMRWHAVAPPEHLTLFTHRSLSLLVERAGFRVEWSGKVNKSFRISYILHTLAHWTRWRFFSRLAAGVEARPARNWAIPLYLRDNLVLVARKLS